MREGFLGVQHAINRAVTALVSGNKTSDMPAVWMRRMPYPPYNDDNFVLVVQNQLPLLLLLSFVFSALNIVKDIVHEKERKIKVDFFILSLYSISRFLVTLGQVTQYVLRWQHFKCFFHG